MNSFYLIMFLLPVLIILLSFYLVYFKKRNRPNQNG